MTGKSIEEWEARMLALPIAGKVSGEHDQHLPSDADFKPFQWMAGDGLIPSHRCACDRCKIIRIKKRRAFRWPKRKCQGCGKLVPISLFAEPCDDCKNKENN